MCLHIVCDPETSSGPHRKCSLTPELERRASGGKAPRVFEDFEESVVGVGEQARESGPLRSEREQIQIEEPLLAPLWRPPTNTGQTLTSC